MPRGKKASKVGALEGFHFDLPFIGFRAQFRSAPIKGKGKVKTHTINYGASCREELVWDSREFLQRQVVNWKKKKGSWEKTATLTHKLDLDHPSLKQPEVTYLWVGDGDEWPAAGVGICNRRCCINRYPELLDAIVGPVAVVLNPNRYVGDWWTTSPSEASVKHTNELRWYGTDNFFLRHPVLTSLMMGMFRQGNLLFGQGYDEAILNAVKRKDVEDCLTNADPVLAMRILTTLRPWIEVPQRNLAGNFSFPRGNWERLRQLHRSIYTHGYDELFDGDLQKSWNIVGETGNPRYGIPEGPVAYWGAKGDTAAGKRLAQLGK